MRSHTLAADNFGQSHCAYLPENRCRLCVLTKVVNDLTTSGKGPDYFEYVVALFCQYAQPAVVFWEVRTTTLPEIVIGCLRNQSAMLNSFGRKHLSERRTSLDQAAKKALKINKFSTPYQARHCNKIENCRIQRHTVRYIVLCKTQQTLFDILATTDGPRTTGVADRAEYEELMRLSSHANPAFGYGQLTMTLHSCYQLQTLPFKCPTPNEAMGLGPSVHPAALGPSIQRNRLLATSFMRCRKRD